MKQGFSNTFIQKLITETINVKYDVQENFLHINLTRTLEEKKEKNFICLNEYEYKDTFENLFLKNNLDVSKLYFLLKDTSIITDYLKENLVINFENKKAIIKIKIPIGKNVYMCNIECVRQDLNIINETLESENIEFKYKYNKYINSIIVNQQNYKNQAQFKIYGGISYDKNDSNGQNLSKFNKMNDNEIIIASHCADNPNSNSGTMRVMLTNFGKILFYEFYTTGNSEARYDIQCISYEFWIPNEFIIMFKNILSIESKSYMRFDQSRYNIACEMLKILKEYLYARNLNYDPNLLIDAINK